MMDDFERDLATLLRSVVSAPPTAIDPAEIIGAPRRRPVHPWGLPVLAALVVATIAVAVIVVIQVVRGGDTAPTTPAAGALHEISPPIPAGDAVILTPDLALVAINDQGATVRQLGTMSLPAGAEVDAVDVSADGRHVVVSVVNDHDRACSATVYSLGDDGTLYDLLSGGAATFSPDGARLAYVEFSRSGEFCYRTNLVVRNLGDGSQLVLPVEGGRTLEGNPPEWPINWSPDGTQLAYVGQDGIVVATAPDGRHWDARRVTGHVDLAPVFVSDNALAVYTGCCSGDMQMTTVSLTGKRAMPMFSVKAPVRSVRRDRAGNGLWLTTEAEPNSLWRWDGTNLRSLPVQALMTSG